MHLRVDGRLSVTLCPYPPSRKPVLRLKRPFDLSGSRLRADRPLNHHGVGPFAEPKSHCAQKADLPKAAGLVQPQRGDIGAVDIPDHLVKPGTGACLDQGR